MHLSLVTTSLRCCLHAIIAVITCITSYTLVRTYQQIFFIVFMEIWRWVANFKECWIEKVIKNIRTQVPVVLTIVFLDTPVCVFRFSRDVFLMAAVPPLPTCGLVYVAMPWDNIGVGAPMWTGGSMPTIPSAGVDVTMPVCCDVFRIKGV